MWPRASFQARMLRTLGSIPSTPERAEEGEGRGKKREKKKGKKHQEKLFNAPWKLWSTIQAAHKPNSFLQMHHLSRHETTVAVRVTNCINKLRWSLCLFSYILLSDSSQSSISLSFFFLFLSLFGCSLFLETRFLYVTVPVIFNKAVLELTKFCLPLCPKCWV